MTDYRVDVRKICDDNNKNLILRRNKLLRRLKRLNKKISITDSSISVFKFTKRLNRKKIMLEQLNEVNAYILIFDTVAKFNS